MKALGLRELILETCRVLALLALVCASAAIVGSAEAPTPSSGDQVARDAARGTPKPLTRKERKERLRALSERYHEFLRSVEPIMMPEELDTFLRLETDAQRDLFIENFWAVRDEDPRRSGNYYREDYEARIEEAKSLFKTLSSDRSRIYLIHGRPTERIAINHCDRYLQPIEVWYYAALAGSQREGVLLFFKPRLGVDYRLWEPIGTLGISDLLSLDGERLGAGQAIGRALRECQNGEALNAALAWTEVNKYDVIKLFEAPEVDTESAAKILRSMVIRNPAAKPIEATSSYSFDGRRGTRTIVQLAFEVPVAPLATIELGGFRYYNLDVNGEVLKDGKLYESYRYQFDYPVESVETDLPVLVERYLRPGEYTSRVKIQDANSGGEVILEKTIEVPYVEAAAAESAAEKEGSETIGRLHEEFRNGEAVVRIVPLPDEILTGYQRIEAITTGEEIENLDFYLDGQKVMSKNRPPWILELDFGAVPSTRRVRVVGLDAAGNIVAGDEVVVNVGADPFRVHIVSPRIVPAAATRARVEVEVQTPEKAELASVDIWVNETEVATLFTPPFVQSVELPGDEVVYVRAVATLEDERRSTAEDMVFVRKPQFLEEIDVHLIELPTTVLRNGRPVNDLNQEAFRVLDEGSPVEIAKFERVTNLPLSIGVAIDSSASMKTKIQKAQEAAARFFASVMKPGDRGFVVAFDDQPYVVQTWTREMRDLSRALASLRATDSTSLYDAIVFSLYHFPGVEGQKAVVLLTDGEDTSSKFEFDQAVEYARRSSVPIYTIGLGIHTLDRVTRSQLARIARETGGNSYFIESTADLDRIYKEIEVELRSQYVLGFYPPAAVEPGSGWRGIRVEVDGATVKTISGYYP